MYNIETNSDCHCVLKALLSTIQFIRAVMPQVLSNVFGLNDELFLTALYEYISN